jgi:hypothetical protein
MKHLLAAIFLSILCDSVAANKRNICEGENAIKYMIWKEAGNQQAHVQILVLRVLENRVKKFKTNPCTELFRRGAYPYMKHGVKPVPKKFTERYNEIRSSKKLKEVKYIYFNHVPHKFGKRTKKIGGLYFSE